jgi:hypothetical protein
MSVSEHQSIREQDNKHNKAEYFETSHLEAVGAEELDHKKMTLSCFVTDLPFGSFDTDPSSNLKYTSKDE